MTSLKWENAGKFKSNKFKNLNFHLFYENFTFLTSILRYSFRKK